MNDVLTTQFGNENSPAVSFSTESVSQEEEIRSSQVYQAMVWPLIIISVAVYLAAGTWEASSKPNWSFLSEGLPKLTKWSWLLGLNLASLLWIKYGIRKKVSLVHIFSFFVFATALDTALAGHYLLGYPVPFCVLLMLASIPSVICLIQATRGLEENVDFLLWLLPLSLIVGGVIAVCETKAGVLNYIGIPAISFTIGVYATLALASLINDEGLKPSLTWPLLIFCVSLVAIGHFWWGFGVLGCLLLSVFGPFICLGVLVLALAALMVLVPIVAIVALLALIGLVIWLLIWLIMLAF